MAKTKIKESGNAVWYALAASRVMLGFIFLWAFFDKLLGLGFATPAARAWVNGGSPTTGFLKNVEGPFADFFNALAGQPWADWLFMLGLLGIGIGLLCGIAVRLSVVFGSVLLFLMWMASLPLENNPIIDDHLVYIAVLLAIAYGLNQQKLSCGKWWQGLSFIKSSYWLK
ncbi:MAG TPA: hypothetical protein VFT59_01085 [Candidatus Saccharimonadales bacterium]|nr:hypothetical protein [Candidatus Saccharimonadales bacterium]